MGQAFSQAPAPTTVREAAAPQQPTEEIVVRGRRMSEVREELRNYVNEFVVAIAKQPPGRGFARWQGHVCIGVDNLQKDAAQYIVDHISHVAEYVGLEPGEPGCTPQVTIIFTIDGKAMATYMVENRRRVLQPAGGLAGMNLGVDALDAFAQSDRAVRWWHVSLPVDSRIGTNAIRTADDKAAAVTDEETAPVISVAGPSRIHSGIRDDLMRVFIIVDSKRLMGTTWQQLADYLAVVSLAQIDPSASPAGFDSILNVFSNPAAYSGLTVWDRSYLRALYSFDQERLPRIQVNELVGRMMRQENEPAAATSR
jgi:hypothetical protein